jgi:hypothetical protein
VVVRRMTSIMKICPDLRGLESPSSSICFIPLQTLSISGIGRAQPTELPTDPPNRIGLERYIRDTDSLGCGSLN